MIQGGPPRLMGSAIVIPGYFHSVLIGVDVLANALLGGRKYQTLSSRIGESITAGGWAARVPWPAWWRAHCLAAVYETIV